MTTVPVGRTLDADGEPVPGSGFEVDPDGEVAAKLRESSGLLVSNPVSREWLAVLERPEVTGGEYLSGVYVIAGDGPPAHYHVDYEETFEVIAGELTVVVEGSPRRVPAGESYTVPPGTVHKPRYDGDRFAAAVGTVSPPGRTLELIGTTWGLTHDGETATDGRPSFLQGMALTAAFADDTVFVSPPPAVTLPLAAVLAPLARRFGYRATYPRYERQAFWERHVEQPSL